MNKFSFGNPQTHLPYMRITRIATIGTFNAASGNGEKLTG